MIRRLLFPFALLFALLLSSQVSIARTVTVYKYFDDEGVLHLSSTAPTSETEPNLVYSRSYKIQPPAPSTDYPLLTRVSHTELDTKKKYKASKKSKAYNKLIKKVAKKYQLPPALLHAMVKVESAYNPKAVSPKGAVGLMQLMPMTAKRFKVRNRYDPEQNLQAGAEYLTYLLKLFNKDLRLAVAAYNAGEGSVKKYGNKIPPYRETRAYVTKVLNLYEKYQTVM